jgi:hypothetical protein
MKKEGLTHCPVQCPNEQKQIDIYRTKYCDECPRSHEMRTFKENTRERWEEWLKDDAGEFDFDEMLTVVYQVMSLESLTDDRISVKSASLRAVYRSEREKAMARATARLSQELAAAR